MSRVSEVKRRLSWSFAVTLALSLSSGIAQAQDAGSAFGAFGWGGVIRDAVGGSRSSTSAQSSFSESSSSSADSDTPGVAKAEQFRSDLRILLAKPDRFLQSLECQGGSKVSSSRDGGFSEAACMTRSPDGKPIPYSRYFVTPQGSIYEYRYDEKGQLRKECNIYLPKAEHPQAVHGTCDWQGILDGPAVIYSTSIHSPKNQKLTVIYGSYKQGIAQGKFQVTDMRRIGSEYSEVENKNVPSIAEQTAKDRPEVIQIEQGRLVSYYLSGTAYTDYYRDRNSRLYFGVDGTPKSITELADIEMLWKNGEKSRTYLPPYLNGFTRGLLTDVIKTAVSTSAEGGSNSLLKIGGCELIKTDEGFAIVNPAAPKNQVLGKDPGMKNGRFSSKFSESVADALLPIIRSGDCFVKLETFHPKLEYGEWTRHKILPDAADFKSNLVVDFRDMLKVSSLKQTALLRAELEAKSKKVPRMIDLGFVDEQILGAQTWSFPGLNPAVEKKVNVLKASAVNPEYPGAALIK